jgi:hypothetical protein
MSGWGRWSANSVTRGWMGGGKSEEEIVMVRFLPYVS